MLNSGEGGFIASGEGGFIATSDDQVAAYCILAAGCYEKLYKKHLARPFNDEIFEELKPYVPNFSLRMNNLTAAVLRPQIGILEKKIQRYKQLYKQLKDILDTVEGIHIPPSLDRVERAPDSMQFNLLNLTKLQVGQSKFLMRNWGKYIPVCRYPGYSPT